MPGSRKPMHHMADLDGVKLFYREAGRPGAPGLLLLHGQPCSSFGFRHVIGPLAEVAHVVAPDLPGFGFTEAPDDYPYTFDAMARTIDALTRKVGLERFFLYVHDFGAPVAYHLALARPDRVLGLIIQNGNAHEEGLGPDWIPNKAYWADPTPENRAKLPEWLNFEGVRHTYVGDIPERLVPLVAPEGWHLDWERMSRPGRVEISSASSRIMAATSRASPKSPPIIASTSRPRCCSGAATIPISRSRRCSPMPASSTGSTCTSTTPRICCWRRIIGNARR